MRNEANWRGPERVGSEEPLAETFRPGLLVQFEANLGVQNDSTECECE